MRCVEFLVLRAPPERAAAAAALLAEGVRYTDQPAELLGHWILRHRTISGDIALMFLWQGEVDPEGSSLGRELRTFLAEYGITNHAMWTAEEAKMGAP